MAATKSLKKCELDAKWYLIDATDCTLGRLAAYTANILRGKHKPTWTPNMDCGDHVIIINADRVALSGHKADKDRFFWHSLWTGSLKSRTLGQMRDEKPEKLMAVEPAKFAVPSTEITVQVALMSMLPRTSPKLIPAKEISA